MMFDKGCNSQVKVLENILNFRVNGVKLMHVHIQIDMTNYDTECDIVPVEWFVNVICHITVFPLKLSRT